jgi:hypothetical protein
MPLNKVQQDFCNQSYRVFAEEFVRNIHFAKALIQEFDNLQAGPDALPINAVALDDAGENPRADAPAATGQDVSDFIDTLRNIVATVSSAEEQAIQGKTVRRLTTILRK